jgi:LacI family transcriptional regulator
MSRARRFETGMATIRDVAEHAGVSAMTVSNVMNGKGRVGEETRDRVRAAVKLLGYRPNAAARSLARAEPVRIGMIYRDFDSVFIRSVVASASTAAAASDVQLLLREPAEDDHAGAACAAKLVEDGARALLLMPPFAEALSGSETLEHLDIPLLALVTGCALPDMATVRIDNHAASFAVTQLLLDRGHRRIGVIAGPRQHSDSQARIEGHETALTSRYCTVDHDLVVEGDFTFPSGIAAADRLLALAHPPTAIIAANDDMAAGALWAAHRRGLQLPRDLAVTGFDDSLVANRVWPPLTTIRQPIDGMTARAIELLLDEITRNPTKTGPKAFADDILDFALIERASSGDEKALVI